MKYFDPEVMGEAMGQVSGQTAALLQGRRTWQIMANAWPKRTNDDPFADWMNSVEKYVVSDTLTDDDATAWRPTTIIRNADLIKEVSALRGQPGGYINTMGSASVVRALLGRRLGRRDGAHDRANRARRRQDHLPRRWRGTPVRAHVGDDDADGGAGLPLPAIPRSAPLGIPGRPQDRSSAQT
jgi:hypothetical protein